MIRIKRSVPSWILLPLLALAGYVLPTIVPSQLIDPPFRDLVGLVLLPGLLGFASVIFFDKHWWQIALALISLVTLTTIGDVWLRPESHNLWPIERFLLGLWSASVVLGCVLGSVARLYLDKPQN